MGGKNQETTNYSETEQKYNPRALEQMNQIWDRILGAANQKYTPYTGQMVANLNPYQIGAIKEISGADKYLDDASRYARQGANPISENAINRYMNPYTNQVVDATQNQFNASNQEQQQSVLGNAVAKGAMGGDRVGVAQGELARQQNLAQNPVIAGLYSQGFNTALGAAQQDRAAAANAANQFMGIHSGALQGGQAQLGAGGVMQNNAQQKLNAQYQQFMQKQQFPYQQAQFLASLGLPVLSAMGGTTSGSSTSTTTTPGPSPFSQIAGLGLAGLGAMGGNPFAFLGGLGSMGGAAQSGMGGYGSPTQTGGYWARGGRVTGGHYAHGGLVEKIRAIREGMRDGGPVIETERDTNGIFVPRGFAFGGAVADEWPALSTNPALPDWMQGPVEARSPGFGAMPAWTSSPYAMPGEAQGVVPSVRAPAAPSNPMRVAMAAPAPVAAPQGGEGAASDILPAAARFASGLAPDGATASSGTSSSTSNGGGGGGLFGLSDDARMGLIAAGLGMAASKSPFALTAIGEGGLAGLRAYGDSKRERQNSELEARKLAMQAEQFAKNFGLRERELEQGRMPVGFERTSGGLQPIPGGPADPAYIDAAGKGGKTIEKQIEDRRNAVLSQGLDPSDPRMQSYILSGTMPRENQQPLTATDKKAILEADEAVLSAETAIQGLEKAKTLSPKAYQGPFASDRGKLTGNLGSEAGQATIELDNVVMGNALGQLKSIFGAAPTEGEREILLKIQGSANLPDALRQKIYDRAIEMAKKRLAMNKDRAADLRGGTFYKPQGDRSPFSGDVSAPQKAIDALRAQPSRAAEFDAKYGAGAAAKILGN